MSDSSADFPEILNVDFKPEALIELVTFMYTGNLRLSCDNALALLKCAEWFGVTVAVKFVLEYMRKFGLTPPPHMGIDLRSAEGDLDPKPEPDDGRWSVPQLGQSHSAMARCVEPCPPDLMAEINSYMKQELVEIDLSNQQLRVGRNEHISFDSINPWCALTDDLEEGSGSNRHLEQTLKADQLLERKLPLSHEFAPTVQPDDFSKTAAEATALAGKIAPRRKRRKKENTSKVVKIGKAGELLPANGEGKEGDGGVTEGQPHSQSKRKSGRMSSEYTCDYCNCVVDTRKELNQHTRRVHGSFSCDECSERFARKECLTRHIQKTHRVQIDWKCHFYDCDQTFKLQTKFLAHCEEVHGESRPYACDFQGCAFKTSRIKSLHIHKENVHALSRDIVCGKCGDRFPSKLYLVNHERNCVNKGQHLCSECGATFNVKQALNHHMRVKHLGEVPFACEICGRRFNDHRNLGRHMRIHSNSFPYTCEYCGQRFRHSNSLKYHVQRLHHQSRV